MSQNETIHEMTCIQCKKTFKCRGKANDWCVHDFEVRGSNRCSCDADSHDGHKCELVSNKPRKGRLIGGKPIQ